MDGLTEKEKSDAMTIAKDVAKEVLGGLREDFGGAQVKESVEAVGVAKRVQDILTPALIQEKVLAQDETIKEILQEVKFCRDELQIAGLVLAYQNERVKAIFEAANLSFRREYEANGKKEIASFSDGQVRAKVKEVIGEIRKKVMGEKRLKGLVQ